MSATLHKTAQCALKYRQKLSLFRRANKFTPSLCLSLSLSLSLILSPSLTHSMCFCLSVFVCLSLSACLSLSLSLSLSVSLSLTPPTPHIQQQKTQKTTQLHKDTQEKRHAL